MVAEGVETRDAWDRLAALSCHEVQGWHLARPMAPVDVPGWLASRPPGIPRPRDATTATAVDPVTAEATRPASYAVT